MRRLFYFSVIILTFISGLHLQAAFTIIHEQVVIDPEGEIHFTLIFNEIPDFTADSADLKDRQAFDFQYFIKSQDGDQLSPISYNFIIRGGEIQWTGDNHRNQMLRIREAIGRDVSPTGSTSGGWGPISKQIPFNLIGNSLTFTISTRLISVKDKFDYRIETYQFGSLKDYIVNSVNSQNQNNQQDEPKEIPTHFLLKDNHSPHSFVLPLTLEENIDDARNIISTNGLNDNPSIFVAKIEPITEFDKHFNRNYLTAGAPTWNWTLTEFVGFKFTTVPYGTPNTDYDSLNLIKNSKYVIFWDFTIVRELGTDLGFWDADLVFDDTINMEDFAQFTLNWLSSDCAHPDWCGGADINGDRFVDIKDLYYIGDHWLERHLN